MSIDELLDEYEPRLKAAFLEAVADLVSMAQLRRVVAALENRDIQSAVNELNLDRAAFEKFERELQSAFAEGGKAGISELGALKDPGGNVFIVRFNTRNLRAESILRKYSTDLVTGIIEDQKEAIRLHLVDGLSKGQNPRTTALDIVGRINKTTQIREGGVIGLSGPQEAAVRNAKNSLLNGDYSSYFSLKKRDKRFDIVIKRAKQEGKALTKDQVSKITGRYSNRLLKLRSDTIARTETLASLNMAQYEGLKQVVDTGKVKQNQMRRVWDAAGDSRTRADHRQIDGQSVGLNEDFIVGGKAMSYPGDPRGGPEQVINCRCTVRTRIDYLSNLG